MVAIFEVKNGLIETIWSFLLIKCAMPRRHAPPPFPALIFAIRKSFTNISNIPPRNQKSVDKKIHFGNDCPIATQAGASSYLPALN
jgi:hypothetical protein